MASAPVANAPLQQLTTQKMVESTHNPSEGLVDLDNKERSDSISAASAGEATQPHLSKEGQDAEFVPAGINRIGAFYSIFGKSWLLWSFWGAFTLWGFAMALSSNTTYLYLSFATSAYVSNNLLSTIAVVASIASAVSQPFWAKWADLWSRHWALLASLLLYVLGYLMTAASSNVNTVAAGQVIYTIGSAGLTFMQSLIIGDLTSLRYRGFVNGAITLPYILFAFVASEIYSALGENNWRWGYGMFCIMMPACLAPIVGLILWADIKAKKSGVLSITASSMRHQVGLAGETAMPSQWARIKSAVVRTDGFGLLLLGFSFAMLLSPPTLVATASGGWANPSMIAMMTCGGVFFLAFLAWEWKGASYPLMPTRVLNRTFLMCVGINFFYFMSAYLNDTYWTVWVYVVTDYNDRGYSYLLQTETVALCLFGTIGGLIQLFWGRYKYLQIAGLATRCIGGGITYYQAASGDVTTATLVMGKLLLYAGAGISAVATITASQASVKHKDLALVIALLSLWTSIGGAVGQAAVGAIWTKNLPMYLAEYAPTLSADEIYNIAYDQYAAHDAEPRAEVIRAFNASYKDCSLPALIIMFVPLVLSLFMTDYKLDSRHNVEEEKVIAVKPQAEVDQELRERQQNQAQYP